MVKHYPADGEGCSEAADVNRPGTSLVLALASLILSPILIFIEVVALIFAAMVSAESANPLWVKVLSGAVVFAVGLLTLAVSVIALVSSTRARAASKATSTSGAGVATAAVVIAGIVTAGVLVAQVFIVLWAMGVCSLDGC